LFLLYLKKIKKIQKQVHFPHDLANIWLFHNFLPLHISFSYLQFKKKLKNKKKINQTRIFFFESSVLKHTHTHTHTHTHAFFEFQKHRRFWKIQENYGRVCRRIIPQV
jgi:hypothetical protein